MIRSLVRVLPCLAVALCAACEDGSLSLSILRNLVSTPPGCLVPEAKEDGLGLSRGTLDVAVGSAYYMIPLVRNDQAERTSGASPTFDQITVVGFDVQVNGDAALVGALQQRAFTASAFGGSLGASDLAAISVRVLSAEAITQMAPAAADGKQHEITIHMRAIGKRADTTFTSYWIDYPITVCDGCLNAGQSITTACPDPLPTPPSGLSCNAGQDGGYYCCTLNGAIKCLHSP